jgi:peroxiredoxin (alkyl hydroperoxide reductase subunit C)
VSAVADKYTEFQKLDTEVLVLSVDTIYVHKVWNESELSKIIPGGIPFPMLTDIAGKIGIEYGVFEESNGVDLRGTFIIDPEGVIQGYEVLTAPVGRNIDEIIRLLQAFQYVKSSKEREVIPSGWRPGMPTLKPGMALIGKVWEIWSPALLKTDTT